VVFKTWLVNWRLDYDSHFAEIVSRHTGRKDLIHLHFTVCTGTNTRAGPCRIVRTPRMTCSEIQLL
jgi:hypothetical protein